MRSATLWAMATALRTGWCCLLRKRAFPLLERSFPLLERVLGIKFGKEGASFIGSASAVIIGLVMAKVFNSLLYLFSGRFLPKDEFGSYALALSA